VIDAVKATGVAAPQIGTLIELTIDPGGVPRPLLQHVVTNGAVLTSGGEMAMAPAFTPVEPGESLVLAVVCVRWQFVPAAR
jgi:hypothetical protein